MAPSTNGDNGRGVNGRFAKGNKGGPGNPFAAKVAKLRKALLGAVTARDMADIVKALVRQAKAGDVASAREVIERCLGKPIEADLLERLEALEAALAAEGKDDEPRKN